MHLAGSPGSYFAYLKDCLEEWSGGLRVGWGTLSERVMRIRDPMNTFS